MPSAWAGAGRFRVRWPRTNSTAVQASIAAITASANVNSTTQTTGRPSKGSVTAHGC